MPSEPVRLLTADGLALVGDLDGAAGTVRGAAVVCHPHPRYGGDRHSPVVTALAAAFAAAGLVTVRFDFRGTGASEGTHGGGIAERADVVAALDTAGGLAPGLPLVLAGYSFGSAVALSVTDARVTAWVGVALPLALAGALALDALTDPRPVLLLSPEHDQFSPADQVVAAAGAARWPAVTVEPVPMADHFLAGRTGAVAALAAAFVERVLAPVG